MSIFVCIAIESEGGDDFAFDTFEYFCQVIVSRPESGLSFTDYLSYFFCRGRVGRMKLMLLRLTTSLIFNCSGSVRALLSFGFK
ncbi:hypothetical protein ACOSQ2_003137 [Xanthoceras sorbifolium]